MTLRTIGLGFKWHLPMIRSGGRKTKYISELPAELLLEELTPPHGRAFAVLYEWTLYFYLA